MNYLKSLFERAKNVGVSTIDYMANGIKGIAGSIKGTIAKSIVKELGPDVINAGADFVSSKLTSAVTDGIKEYSPLKMLSAFLNSKPSVNTMETQFSDLLKNARTQLDGFAAEENDPLTQSGIHIASRFLDGIDKLKDDCFKLQKKKMAEFKREGLEAIKLVQPQLEKALTKCFTDVFLTPFINFFKELLLVLFSVDKTARLASPVKPQPEKAETAKAEDVNDNDYEQPSAPAYASM